MTKPPDRDLLLPYDFEDKFDYDKIQNRCRAGVPEPKPRARALRKSIPLLTLASISALPCTISSSEEAISSPTKPDALVRVVKCIMTNWPRDPNTPAPDGTKCQILTTSQLFCAQSPPIPRCFNIMVTKRC
jgi:hypothetical protein